MFDKMIKKMDFNILTDDRRKEIKSINYEYPSLSVEDLEGWENKREKILARIYASTGLALEQNSCKPLSVTVTETHSINGITVENIALELFEGFYVTGNLYRPEKIEERIPAILNPHGHWDDGRFESNEMVDVPARCANFAKMGMVAFTYDMIGHGDSCQMGHFDEFPDEALHWNIGHFSLQLISSICVLEYLLTLSYVDTRRIGVAGASGGATQALFLAAIDERIAACAPVCMISYHMQGGCVCENAPGLRYDMNNVELAATIAPRPMHIVACSGDWTYSNGWREKPDIQKVYDLYGAPEKLEFTNVIASHNYNLQSREAVYDFFNRVFLREHEEWKEQDIPIPTHKQRQVFQNGLPDGALNGVNEIAKKWIARRKDVKLTEGEALAILENAVGAEKIVKQDYQVLHTVREGKYQASRVFTTGTHCLAAYVIEPTDIQIKDTLIIITKAGAQITARQQEHRIKTACDNGSRVILPTLTYLKDDKEANHFKDVKEHQHYQCYNYTVSALDIQDIVLAVKTFAKGDTHIVGLSDCENVVLASLPYLREVVQFVRVENNNPFLDIPGVLAMGGLEKIVELSDIICNFTL